MTGRTIEILYDQPDWAVVNKPAGLAVQPGAGVRTSLVDELTRLWGDKPYLVHRLDRETAGCLIVARSARAARRLAGVLAAPDSIKRYLALVKGVPAQASGEIRDAIETRGERRAALSRWRLVRPLGGLYALLEVEIITGRTHQIRIHLANSGFPILADDRYGDFKLNRELKKSHRLKRLLLFASELELAKLGRITAPWPAHFKAFCDYFE